MMNLEAHPWTKPPKPIFYTYIIDFIEFFKGGFGQKPLDKTWPKLAKTS